MSSRRAALQGCLPLLVTVSLVICVGCGGLFGFAQLLLPRANLPPGYVVGACATLTPSLTQFQAWWDTRYITDQIFFPQLGLYGLCGFLPWLPTLPAADRIVFRWFNP